jgi:diguanylate cyclase (GGDEF)-like protein
MSRVLNSDGSVRHFRSSARDVTERWELAAVLERQATELRDQPLHDGLTGLYNRRGFMEFASNALKAAQAGNERACLFFADLDGLKGVNDRHGHAAGDRFIAEAARVLRSSSGAGDVLARLGGDEFVVLAPGCGDPSDLTERVERRVAEANDEPGRSYELSFSIGVAAFDPADPSPLEELIKLADARMYEAKVQRRRNRSLLPKGGTSSGRIPVSSPLASSPSLGSGRA